MSDDILKVATFAERVLPLQSACLGNEYYYQSLPTCVLDAVFSMGVNYGSAQNVISRYCRYFSLIMLRSDRSNLPPQEEQESISSLCDRFEQLGFGVMTHEVFINQHRTSPRNGILKAEATLEFACALRNHEIEYLQDIPAAMRNESLEQEIRQIPGQRSGKSLQYFWMLTGSDEFVKPDRMILRFLEVALGRAVMATEAQTLLSGAAGLLRTSFHSMTPRLLDHEVWKYQRAVAGNTGHC